MCLSVARPLHAGAIEKSICLLCRIQQDYAVPAAPLPAQPRHSHAATASQRPQGHGMQGWQPPNSHTTATQQPQTNVQQISPVQVCGLKHAIFQLLPSSLQYAALLLADKSFLPALLVVGIFRPIGTIVGQLVIKLVASFRVIWNRCPTSAQSTAGDGGVGHARGRCLSGRGRCGSADSTASAESDLP